MSLVKGTGSVPPIPSNFYTLKRKNMSRTRKYIVVATAAALLAGGVSSANAAAPKKLLGIVSITATDAGNARVIKGATAAAKAAGSERAGC